MKNNYGKDTNTKYQAAGANKENRNPNAPTQGGFPKGGDQGKNLNTDKSKTQQPKQPGQGQQNTWGTGSINDKNKDRR